MNENSNSVIYFGDSPIKKLFVGEMGVKQLTLSDGPLYIRSGGYFYLELDTKGVNN